MVDPTVIADGLTDMDTWITGTLTPAVTAVTNDLTPYAVRGQPISHACFTNAARMPACMPFLCALCMLRLCLVCAACQEVGHDATGVLTPSELTEMVSGTCLPVLLD